MSCSPFTLDTISIRMVTSFKKTWDLSYLTYQSRTLSLEMLLKRVALLKREEAVLFSSIASKLRKKFRSFLKRSSRTRKDFLTSNFSKWTHTLALKCSFHSCSYCSQVCLVVRTSTGTNATTKSILSRTPIPLANPKPMQKSEWLRHLVWLANWAL